MTRKEDAPPVKTHPYIHRATGIYLSEYQAKKYPPEAIKGRQGRPEKPKKSVHPQVLMNEVEPYILDRKPFDAGNLHGRWTQKRNGVEPRYEVRSYETVIAFFNGDKKDSRGEWTMVYLGETTPTTRRHVNVVQKVVNHFLYSGKDWRQAE